MSNVRHSRMRRSSAVFILFIAALFCTGLVVGSALANLPKLETFKLLNIIGLIYDLLGLIVLSEMVTASDRWRSFVVSWGAGAFLWGQSVIPLGAALGAWIIGGSPSATKATTFFGLLWAYSLLPLAVLDATVFYPRFAQLQNTEQRTRRLGLGLLLAGVLVQLAAAFKDLYA